MSQRVFKPHWQGMLKFFLDKHTALFPKILAVLALVYLVWPIDLFPDLVPFLGWLDDIGLATVALSYLSHATKKYMQRQEQKSVESAKTPS